MIRVLLILFVVLIGTIPSNPSLSAADLPYLSPDVGIVRGPYLQLGTSTGVVIRWRTDQPSASRVLYGSSPESLDNGIEFGALTTEHEIQLDGLTPNTTYFYAVGTSTHLLAGGNADYFFTTSPAPGTDRATRIWVLGDQGLASAPALQVRDAYHAYTGDRATDLWLMLGDNAYYYGTEPEYQATVFEKHADLLRQSVLWPVFGNHDGYSANGTTQTGPYFDLFTLPTNGEAGGVPSGTEAYYSFDYGNIHFVVLDSEDSIIDNPTTMLDWLEADLADTDEGWIIALWHHAPYSKGSHDSDTEWKMAQMRARAVPILEDYGVDLVLTGHSHAYERTFLLDGHYDVSTTLTGDMILDGDYGNYAKLPGAHHGAVYVTAGNAASLLGGPLNHPAMATSQLRYGSMVVDVEDDWLNAVLLDEQGLVIDAFTIHKQGAAPPPTPTATASPTSTATPTFTATATPTMTPTATATSTASPTSEPGVTATASPSATSLPSPSPTPTATATPQTPQTLYLPLVVKGMY